MHCQTTTNVLKKKKRSLPVDSPNYEAQLSFNITQMIQDNFRNIINV